MLLRLFEPSSAWGRAGLHTGDRIVTMNGLAITSWPEMRAFVTKLRIGMEVRLVIVPLRVDPDGTEVMMFAFEPV